MGTLLPPRLAAVSFGVDWPLVIVVVLVVAVSACIRLGFYFWWRGTFGGRPVKEPAQNSSDETHVVDWTDRDEKR